MKTRRRSRPIAAALGAILALALVPTTAAANSGTTPALLRTLGGPSHAEMMPSGLEMAADGNVIIANTGDNAVAKYNTTTGARMWRIGTHGTGQGGFFNPRDVAVDSLGRVYVADTRNSRIVRLTANGQWDTSFGQNGAAVGPTGNRISWPMGVTIKNDVLYIADAGRSKVRAFDLNGSQIREWASSTSACDFPDLRDVDADGQGNIYIANYKRSNITVLQTNGSCRTFGTNGTGDAQFKTPYGVRVARDPVTNRELVYVADGNNNRVKVFTKSGQAIGAFGTTGQPPTGGTFAELRRVAVAADGDVWAADLWGWRIERFDRTQNGWTFAQNIGDPLPAPTPNAVFHEAHQTAFAADGSIWVADRVHHRLVQMNPNTGAIIKTCGRRGSANGQFNWPQGVAIDPGTGNLWVANTKQYNIHIVNPTNCNGTAKMGTFGSGVANLNWPYAIVIRSDRVAFLPDNKNNRIVSYDVAGKVAKGAFGTVGTGVGQFREPGGIGLHPTNGNIYVADTLNNRIVELSSANGSSFTWVRAIDGAVAGGFDKPGGVAVDAAGRIAVADTMKHRVVLLNANGSLLGIIDTPSMDDPESVAFAPDGKLFVSDTYNDRVLVFQAMSGGGTGPDSTPPDATVTSPRANQRFASAPVAMSGSATDDVGVKEVRLAVRDRSTLMWLQPNGTWASGFAVRTAALSSPGGTSTGWSWSFNPTSGSGQYALQVIAVDGAGNVDPTKPWVPFDIG